MQLIKILLLTLFLFQGSLFACSCKGAISYAQKINAKDKKGKIPDMKLRRYIFECTGLVEKTQDLDELDKDFLYMKASSYIREEFENSKTQTSEPRKYSDFLPKETIDKLFEVMKKIYSGSHKQ